MSGSPATIGDAGRERVRLLGLRPQGVTVAEVEEEFGVSRSAAWRYVRRMLKECVLFRSPVARRRVEVFGADWPGRPATVYRARRASDYNAVEVVRRRSGRPRKV